MLHNLVCSLPGPREPGSSSSSSRSDPDLFATLLLLHGIHDRSTCGRAAKQSVRISGAAAFRAYSHRLMELIWRSLKNDAALSYLELLRHTLKIWE